MDAVGVHCAALRAVQRVRRRNQAAFLLFDASTLTVPALALQAAAHHLPVQPPLRRQGEVGVAAAPTPGIST